MSHEHDTSSSSSHSSEEGGGKVGAREDERDLLQHERERAEALDLTFALEERRKFGIFTDFVRQETETLRRWGETKVAAALQEPDVDSFELEACQSEFTRAIHGLLKQRLHPEERGRDIARELVRSLSSSPYVPNRPLPGQKKRLSCCSRELYVAQKRYFCPLCSTGPVTAYGLWAHLDTVHREDVVSAQWINQSFHPEPQKLQASMEESPELEKSYLIHLDHFQRQIARDKFKAEVFLKRNILCLEVMDFHLTRELNRWQNGPSMDSDPLLRHLGHYGLIGMATKPEAVKNFRQALLTPRPRRCTNCCCQLYEECAGQVDEMFPPIRLAAWGVKMTIVLDGNDIYR